MLLQSVEEPPLIVSSGLPDIHHPEIVVIQGIDSLLMPEIYWGVSDCA
jgi:hypothetical protein